MGKEASHVVVTKQLVAMKWNVNQQEGLVVQEKHNMLD
jgi:hypothetical protein